MTKKATEILTIKDPHLGPAVIGKEQHEANLRLAAQQGKHGGGLGPLVVMTPAEVNAWYAAGKPEAWQGWLENYREEQALEAEIAAETENEAPKRGKKAG